MPTPKIIVFHCSGALQYFIKENGVFVSLSERKLAQQINNFQDFTVQAKEKQFQDWIKSAAIICTAKIRTQLPNAPAKIHLNGKKRSPTPDDFRNGVKAFLATERLFESRTPGNLLLADALCGMHAMALKEAEPSFSPIISISSNRPEIEIALRTLIEAIVLRRRWSGKHCIVKRYAVLSYVAPSNSFPLHILDHSRLKITPKRAKGLQVPFPYTDTMVLIIGANSAQIREANPYLENASIVLLNSASGDLTPTKLSVSDIAAYDPTIVAHLNAERHHIASLLRWWWSLFDDEDAWAQQIIQAAHASFGKPDGRYIRVELNPKKLRDAVRYQVLLSFFNEVEKAGFITNEELAPYRQGAKDVFEPAPPEPVHLRHVEDPDVFLEIMRAMVENPSAPIVAENERFVKKDKPLAAWRIIGKERYLIFLEDTWARTYAKLVRSRKDIECSYLQHERWERDFQKLLCEQNLIKTASSGYRYRYDLMGNGTRDNTYVVAVPAHLLED